MQGNMQVVVSAQNDQIRQVAQVGGLQWSKKWGKFDWHYRPKWLTCQEDDFLMPPLPYTRFRLFLYGKSPTLIGQRLFPPTTIITMLVAVQLHSLFNFIAVVLKGNGSICGNGVSHLSKPPLTVPPYCYPLTSDLYAWRCANMNSATTQPQATVKPHIISQYE